MSNTLVSVGGFPNVVEAEIARQALEQEGIRAFVQEDESSVLWGIPSLGEVQLEVLEEDRERAARLLKELEEPAGRHRHRRHVASQESVPGRGPERD